MSAIILYMTLVCSFAWQVADEELLVPDSDTKRLRTGNWWVANLPNNMAVHILWTWAEYGWNQERNDPFVTGDPKAKCQGLEFRIWTLRYKNFQSTFIHVTPALSCTLLSSLTKEVVVMRDLSSEHHGWWLSHSQSLGFVLLHGFTRILYSLLCFRLYAFCGLLCHSSLCDHFMWFM